MSRPQPAPLALDPYGNAAEQATAQPIAVAAPRQRAGRIRVVLLLGSLCGGGAERVAINLMNRCDPAQVDVRLALLRRDGAFLGEVDAARVAAAGRRTDRWTSSVSAPAEIARMVRAVRPQVLMSFGMGVDALAWLALRGLGAARPSWICRQDSNPAAELGNLPVGALGRRLVGWGMKTIHRQADALVAPADDLAASIDRAAGPGRRSTRVIHNPVDVERIERLASASLVAAPDRPFVIAAGRLVRQKGFDLLIKAFADSEAARGMDLVILGDGPLESDLKRQAAALGIADRVRFPGFQANPWAWFARARLFCLPSRWEGFGNVVAEAMASGAPSLVSDCDFGPREQVVHGVSGWVVKSEDTGAIAAGLDTLLGAPDLMARIAAAGALRARAYDVAAIAEDYTSLFLEQAASLAAAKTAPRWPDPEAQTQPVPLATAG